MKLDKKSPICPIVHVDTKKNPSKTNTYMEVTENSKKRSLILCFSDISQRKPQVLVIILLYSYRSRGEVIG